MRTQYRAAPYRAASGPTTGGLGEVVIPMVSGTAIAVSADLPVSTSPEILPLSWIGT
jgi:hypothetical protein